jgi:hypothetical protein
MAAPRNIKSTSPATPAANPTSFTSPAPSASPVVERSEFKGSGNPKIVPSTPRSITHDQIAKRAFEIYASRGYAPGDQNADWLEAERQLKAGL